MADFFVKKSSKTLILLDPICNGLVEIMLDPPLVTRYFFLYLLWYAIIILAGHCKGIFEDKMKITAETQRTQRSTEQRKGDDSIIMKWARDK